MAKDLNELMQFDHVVRVMDDGEITDDRELTAGICAPESYMDADWDDHGDGHVMKAHQGAWKDAMDRAGWEYITPRREFGRYGEPFMDNHELIGEYNFGEDMRERPGYYVAVTIEMLPPEGDERDHNAYGWAVLYRDAEPSDN